MKPVHTFLIALGAAVLSSFLGTCASGAEFPPRLHLIRADGSALSIVLAQDAAPHTRAAAAELAAHLEHIGGVRPEVIEGLPDPLPAQAIWVGYQPALGKLFPKADFALKYPEEVFLIGNENHLAITGRDKFDPQHAVFPGRRFPIENKQQEHGNANAVFTFFDTVFEHWATMAPYYYLIGQLAWNPRADGHAILDDYFRRCHSPAAAPMKKYWLLMEKTRGELVHKVASVHSAFSVPDYYNAAFFAESDALIALARTLAGPADGKHARRAEFTRCGLDYTRAIVGIRAQMRQFEKAKTDADREPLKEAILRLEPRDPAAFLDFEADEVRTDLSAKTQPMKSMPHEIRPTRAYHQLP